MNRGSNRVPIAASPLLVGAVVVLVTIVAVFLSYNANSGLPFVPTYQVNAKVPDAAELVVGNEVRIGGSRVGTVVKIDADTPRDGRPLAATLQMNIDKQQEPLPADTRVRIRQRSNLGLKYVELDPGRSKRDLIAGATIPARQSVPVVDLEDALNSFDAATRKGVARSVTELGTGLGTRGEDLNRAIAAFPELLGRLAPVARNISDPRTQLHQTILGFRSATAAVAPVSENLVGLFDFGATTFRALADERPALTAILSEAPPTEAVGTNVLRRARPVLDDTAVLARNLRPGVRALPLAGNRLAAAMRTGTPVLRRTPGLADRLDGTLGQIRTLSRDPATGGSLRKLTTIASIGQRFLTYANPVQVKCNYLGLFFVRNVTGIIRQGDALGNWFRAEPIFQPSTLIQSGSQADDLHMAAYPDQGQNGQCESGNENYLPGKQLGNTVPGVQPGFTERTTPPAGTPNPAAAPVR